MTADDPFARMEARRMKREQRRAEIQRQIAHLDHEAEQDEVALGVLHQLYAEEPETKVQVQAEQIRGALTTLTTAVRASIGVVAPPVPPELMVKDQIIAILREACPVGMTSGQIKARARVKYGADLNPNTLTVTLVRASKNRPGHPALVQCARKVWYYIGPGAAAPRLDLTLSEAAE